MKLCQNSCSIDASVGETRWSGEAPSARGANTKHPYDREELIPAAAALPLESAARNRGLLAPFCVVKALFTEGFSKTEPGPRRRRVAREFGVRLLWIYCEVKNAQRAGELSDGVKPAPLSMGH
ncbi:hypothetical protein MMARJ_00730 [Mycobacterium marseillense]|uniref:Uncharacterized protein n=1 Tax=Mycobacterium marseillense TaxID=701042 RepID=A0ABN5ZNF8_9MYCO|nr:hypothetical protein MMARJ_00730 [Mycobacterium marseillense]